MASLTTLQGVNHLRRQLRLGDDLSALDTTNPEHLALRDILNQAIAEVLEEYRWEFEERHDGVLNTVADVLEEESTEGAADAATFTNASTAFSTSAATLTFGDYVWRVMVPTDGSVGDTAHRVVSFNNGTTSGTLDAAFLGTTDAGGATAHFFVAEYILPATVKKVTSVRYQEQDLELIIDNAGEGFTRAVPRIHDEISDNPRVAIIGGQMESTYNAASASAGTVGLLMLVHPVPDTAYRLEYSYVERQAELSADADALSNVPPYIIHEVRRRGMALAFSTQVANDPELSALNLQISERRIRRLHALHRPDAGNRRRLASLDEVGGGGASLPKDPYFHGEP